MELLNRLDTKKMPPPRILVTALLFFSLAAGSHAELGPQIWRIDTSSAREVVANLIHDGFLDTMKEKGHNLEALVHRKDIDFVQRALTKEKIPYSVVVEDLYPLIDAERDHMEHRRRKRSALGESGTNMDWNGYHRLEDIYGYISWLHQTYPNVVEVKIAGYSGEGRSIPVVKVTNPNSKEQKMRIWIEGGIHAREWISPAVTTYLLRQVATSDEWRDLLDITEWYIVPMANPDGYDFSFRSKRTRMWRKNRRENAKSTCMGVDLNRNWDRMWGVGASSSPCSETYKGTDPFSEPETRALRDMMKSVGKIDLFITFHSYGQTVLYPWGWSRENPPNVDELEHGAKMFAKGVWSSPSSGTRYETGGSGPLYGLASGATDDWAYDVLKVPYSYTIELRDDGRYGFLLPENQVSETVVESVAGMHCMVQALTKTGECGGRRRPIKRFPVQDLPQDVFRGIRSFPGVFG